MQVDVYETVGDLELAAADLLSTALSTAPVTLGLAGGTTPIVTYRILRERPLPWEQVTCWLPDERWVPPEDPGSNAHMARRSLTDHVPAQLIAPDTTLADPAESAAAYARLLAAEFDDGPDVVLLGMGADGHTASLFPGTEALAVDEPSYVANWVDRFGTWRLTATAPLLHRAGKLLFLVAGEAKADAVRQVLVDEYPHPARLVAEGATDVIWMLDAKAAAEL